MKVLNILWRLTEHRSYLDLVVIKEYLLTAKPLTTERRFMAQYSPRQGQWEDRRS